MLLQEFVSMYRATGDELQLILQQAAATTATAAAKQRHTVVVRAGSAESNAEMRGSSSAASPNACISTADLLGAEALLRDADQGMQLDGEDTEEECYADDEELNAAVGTLCGKLLSRHPLVAGTASAEQRCRALEAEIGSLEAEVAGRSSPAAKRAAGKRLAAVMQLKCLECDLTCTLLEQHAAAEDLTAGGPATFKLHWHDMLQLEARARALKKQLIQQHGVQLELEPFPGKAAAAVLALATASDARRRRYLAAAWKVAQRVSCRSSRMLAGLRKSSSMTGRKLAEKISGSSRQRLSLQQQ
jgi:hypothetical protein